MTWSQRYIKSIRSLNDRVIRFTIRYKKMIYFGITNSCYSIIVFCNFYNFSLLNINYEGYFFVFVLIFLF